MISPLKAPYVLRFSKRATKDFGRLETVVQQQVWAGLGQVCAEGFGDIKALKGEYKGLLRVRVGNYRVVIQVLEFVVFIVEINDRKDSYK